MSSALAKYGYSLLFSLIFMFTYLPIILLAIFSFNDSISFIFPLKGFTLRWYQQLFQTPTAIEAIVTTFKIASVTAAVVTAFSVATGLAVVRHRFLGKRLFVGMIILPITIPFVIIGAALLVFFSNLGIELSTNTVIIGHILIALPYGVLTMTSRLIGFDVSLEEAARDLGAGRITTFWKITLPLTLPGIIVTALMAFTISYSNVSLTFFVIGREVTMPLFVVGMLRYPRFLPVLASLSVLMLFFGMLVALGMRILEKFEKV